MLGGEEIDMADWLLGSFLVWCKMLPNKTMTSCVYSHLGSIRYRSVARGQLPPEIFSVTTSLQKKVLKLQRKSTNNASRDRLRPLGVPVCPFSTKKLR